MKAIDKQYILAVLTAAAITSPAAAFAQSATLDEIRSSGEITLGYRETSVPFAYLDANQTPVGISIDLCNIVVDKIKAELDMPDLNVSYAPTNASNRIPLIQNGTIDLECGSTTNTAKRQEEVAFSVATFVGETSWLTKKDSGIDSDQDLDGKVVAVTQGSLNLPVAEKANAEKNLGFTVIQGKEQAESLLLLRTGRADAWFEDNILQAGLVASAPDSDSFKFVKGNYGGAQYYGLMLRKGDDEFKALVDSALSEAMTSGRYAELYDKWFTQPIPPNDENLNLPMSDGLKARVENPSDSLE